MLSSSWLKYHAFLRVQFMKLVKIMHTIGVQHSVYSVVVSMILQSQKLIHLMKTDQVGNVALFSGGHRRSPYILMESDSPCSQISLRELAEWAIITRKMIFTDFKIMSEITFTDTC